MIALNKLIDVEESKWKIIIIITVSGKLKIKNEIMICEQNMP